MVKHICVLVRRPEMRTTLVNPVIYNFASLVPSIFVPNMTCTCISGWLPVKRPKPKTAPVQNSPTFGQNGPNSRLKRLHYKRSSAKAAANRKVNVVLCQFSINPYNGLWFNFGTIHNRKQPQSKTAPLRSKRP